MPEFYSNKKLLAALDKNGEKPELYIVCSRVRGPGKTFSFAEKLFTDYMTNGDKFILLCRTMGELGAIADGMMKSMLAVKYPEYSVYERIMMKGCYSNIYCEHGVGEDKETEHIGYVIPLNSADKIKKISSMFVDAVQGYMDEFQPEDEHTYLPHEVDKFLSIHTSIARGNGESRRYFPIYMSSNTIDITNPYFVALGLTSKLQENTKFYRGDGFVFERCTIDGLVKKHAESAMSRAFSKNKSIQYSDNSWVNNNKACIEKPNNWGYGTYICTLEYDGKEYGLKYYSKVNLYYLDRTIDKSCKSCYALTLNGEKNYPLLKTSMVIKMVKRAVEMGNIRFKDQGCKQIALEMFV